MASKIAAGWGFVKRELGLTLRNVPLFLAAGGVAYCGAAYINHVFPFARHARIEQIHNKSQGFIGCTYTMWYTNGWDTPGLRAQEQLELMKRVARTVEHIVDTPDVDHLVFSTEKTVQLKEWPTNLHRAAEKLTGHDCASTRVNGFWDGKYFETVVLMDRDGEMTKAIEDDKRKQLCKQM